MFLLQNAQKKQESYCECICSVCL